MIQFILLLFSILQITVGYLWNMNPLKQYYNMPLSQTYNKIKSPYCTNYGFFTKYHPLTDILQIGEIGILDSNCFHIHHTRDDKSDSINLLFYDCIDFERQQIEKSYAFIGNDGNVYKKSYFINKNDYESQWYFFGVTLNLSEEKLAIHFFKDKIIINTQEYNVLPKYYESDLFFVLGGDLQIQMNQTLFNEEISKLSYFPGRMVISATMQTSNRLDCQIKYFQNEIKYYSLTCQCKLNSITKIPDILISGLFQKNYKSDQLNCDSFHFQTWIRIKERNYFIKEIYYQLIKISAHLLNPKLIDDNLSPFQLYYKLNENFNQIIIKTYSYTFPIVNIGEQNNPFLIEKNFDIDINIQLWHFLQVKKNKESLSVKIYFYEAREVKEYIFESIVNHFNLIRFQILYGNILQTQNYLTIQLISMKFYNCDTQINQEQCHVSCLECDGPTQTDCLTCDSSKNKIYNEKQKACTCPYGKIDQGVECKDYSAFQLNIVSENKDKFQCSYGYYEFEDQCWKCPSKIRDKLITCIECLTNPKNWIKNPFCQYNYVSDNNGSPFQKLDQGLEVLFFDGNDLNLSKNQENNKDLYQDYLQSIDSFSIFFQKCQRDVYTDKCFIFKYCEAYEIQLFKPICTQCIMNYQLKDGICIKQQTTPVLRCETPNYQTYYNVCILCPIVNCLYCFDYLKDDVKQNTILYKFSTEQIDSIEKQVLVGCAQCLQGYIYDFRIGECIYKQTEILNCLRSYVNQEGKELCILSAINDFTIAPEILNCQNHILNCKQCYKNIQTNLMCLVCEKGYTSSFQSGFCESIDYYSEETIISYYDENIWRYFVQSFTILFTQRNYLQKGLQVQLRRYAIQCEDGYQQSYGSCIKYCDKNCQKCEKKEGLSSSIFTCTLCDLNPYYEPYRVQQDGKCVICPSYCLVCQIRSNESIAIVNPYYIIEEENVQFTTQCLKSVSNPNIYINPYLQVAQYIYDPSLKIFEYSVLWICQIHSSMFSYPFYFENNFDFTYFNEIALQQFLLTLNLFQPCDPSYEIFDIKNYLQSKVFSLEFVKLKLQGNFQPYKVLRIQNFTEIEFSNLQVNINKTLIFEFYNNGKTIDYQMMNITFLSNRLEQIILNITMNVNQICNIKDVSIVNVIFDSQIIFSIDSTKQQENILIDSFSLIDCIISNTVLFNLNTNSRNIIIENFVIDRCELTNVTIFNILQTALSQIYVKSAIIRNSKLINSSFLSSYGNNLLYIYSFQIIESQILNSQLIKFSKDLFCYNLLIQANLFDESILFEKQFSIYFQSEIIIDNINIMCNIFQKFKLLDIDQNKIQPNQIKLANLIFEDNSSPYKEINDYLFKLSCQIVLIQNVSIINTPNHRYFYLFNSTQIKLTNVSAENQLLNYRIPLNLDCAISNYQYFKLLSVKGFQVLNLGFMNITNQISIDQSFIEIQSNDQTLNQEYETIIIQNITILRNILMKISQGSIFSIITIYSDKKQQIHFENILYQENSYYEYIVDPAFSSASLLFINSINSSILLQNIQCFENSLTNSSNSFLTISTNEIEVLQIQVFYHNYLSTEFWNKYYQIQLGNDLNQIEINYIIEQILSIKNIGGVMQLITEKFTLQNSQFQYIIAKSSSGIEITTKGKGIVILNHCSIAYSQNNLLQNSQQTGSISIHSQNSYLNLKVQNFNFTNVHNKLDPAILSIQPSGLSNNILIKNIIVSDCFSLINTFLAISFPYQEADFNQITIENIFISQSHQASLQFNSQLNLLEPIILSKITQDNAFFNLQGCVLQIRNFQFEGFTFSTIFTLINCKKISLMNILLYQITLFYNMNLLHIEYVAQFKSIMQIQDLTINDIKIFNSKNQKLSPLDYPNFFVEQTKCQILKVVQVPIIQQQLDIKQNNFELIQSYSTFNGSILYIKCSNNQTKIYFNSIQLLNNNCKIYKNGLIFFQLIDFFIIQIKELSCIGNIVQEFGCITALSDNNHQNGIVIMNSFFINNTGGQGVAVTSVNVKTVLFNIKICNNTAVLQGGGLYIDLNNQEFSIQSTLIMNNKAREGGGIYFHGDSILSEKNFMKSLLNLNQAELTTNNLQEQPSHLDLSINNHIMLSDYKLDQLQSKSLKLQPYRIIQQGKELLTNTLMIPSNQEITKYELYNPKQLKFISYVSELSIQFKNRLNEQLLNLPNSTCQIIESIFDIKNQTRLESNNVTILQFNQTSNNFDLGMQIFNLDPYNQTDRQYEIGIYCKTKNQIAELSYNLRVKSLVCQLGEFYVLNGCLTCQSKQGFYSVTYNATKCSIFDKTKFDEITSNNINLKPGFWRPHPQSDLINDCFKNVKSCKGGWVVGNDICLIGYIGGLCEECDKLNIRGDGYYFKNDQYSCWNCRDFQINIVSLFLITVWVFLSTVITLTSVEKTNQLFVLFKLTQKFYRILFKMNLNQESILLKLFLNYIYIFSVISTFNIQFSFSFIFVDQMSHTSYFLTRNLDCQMSQSFEIELIYIRVLVMFTLIALQIFIVQLGANIISILTKVRYRNNILTITVIYLYIQNYAALINQLFSIMAKREISNIDYVQGDVSLLFNSSNHQAWFYRFALPVSLLLGLIIPISLLWLLYKNRNLSDKIKFRRHIGYLLNEYSNNSSFWEWVKLWQKTVIIVILIYFETNIFLKSFLIGICLTIYQLIASYYMPYIFQKLNKLDQSSGQQCLIAIFLGAISFLCEQQENNVQARICQVLIILISLKFSFPYFFDILSAYYVKHKEKFIQLLIIVLKTVQPKSILILKLVKQIEQSRQKRIRIEQNFQKLRQLANSQRRQDKKEYQKITIPTLSLNEKKSSN